MNAFAVLLILGGLIVASGLVFSRSASATPKSPPRLDPQILGRVDEFRTIAARETEGLTYVRVSLVLAIIARETGGISRPGAAGELGLMQVSEAAWQDYQAEKNDPDAINFSDLESPDINIRVGAWFLDRKIADMRGKLYDGIRAYNCGARGAEENPTCGATYAEWIINTGEPAFRVPA